ncbi:uncharacterized protein N0V89_010548 [Didymosphaeria variabile]|uniref:Uncharacterized protein n=1 Tax=Didymosphaeria variabile TaxID=1932322 RepID=A0A9W8XCC8_9PLEO|nr:uncharacterized protein N0V89_010548 [Didymosphaeria variabile]KAJ4346617.1 hypothetical protein N0V89_010548 [Didymosphaeria variabile]
MSLPTSLLLLLASILPTTAASPITPETHILHKRSPSSHNIGIGFAIAISVLTLASLIFYLGVQRGRTGSWFCWRTPIPSLPASPTEKAQPVSTDTLKSRISSPIQMLSSALPELSPLEAQPPFAELSSPAEEKEKPKPKFLELSTTEKGVFEMGQASPRRPPSVATVEEKSFYSSRKSSLSTVYARSVASVKTRGKSVYSTHERPPKVTSWFDRRSWFCRGAMEVEDEEKKIRGWGEDADVEDVGSSVAAPPAAEVKDVGGTVAAPPAAGIAEPLEAHKRQSTMDWSGMEWLTKVYNGRKSRRLSGMRSFYIGDEK